MGVMLIVDENFAWAKKFFPPLLGKAWEIRIVPAVWEALPLVEESLPLSGAIVHVTDGCGLRGLIPLLEAICPRIPVLILSDHSNDDVINTAHLLGAELVVKKPACANNVRLYATRALAGEHATASAAKESSIRIRAFADEHELTRRHVEIITLARDGVPKPQIAAQLGIKLATVKSHVHTILQGTGFATLSDLLSALTPGPASGQVKA